MFCLGLPSSTLHAVGRFLSTVLARLREPSTPNMASSGAAGLAAGVSRLRDNTKNAARITANGTQKRGQQGIIAGILRRVIGELLFTYLRSRTVCFQS